MDEVRKKLIDILATVPMAETVMSGLRAGKHSCYAAFMADHLIANGVTIQRWIPVTERLPKLKKIEDPDGDDWRESEFVLVSTASKEVREGLFWKVNDEYGWVSRDDVALEVTSWMPLPQAPGKEGA